MNIILNNKHLNALPPGLPAPNPSTQNMFWVQPTQQPCMQNMFRTWSPSIRPSKHNMHGLNNKHLNSTPCPEHANYVWHGFQFVLLVTFLWHDNHFHNKHLQVVSLSTAQQVNALTVPVTRTAPKHISHFNKRQHRSVGLSQAKMQHINMCWVPESPTVPNHAKYVFQWSLVSGEVNY